MGPSLALHFRLGHQHHRVEPVAEFSQVEAVEFLVKVLQLRRVGIEIPPRIEVDEGPLLCFPRETSDVVITGTILVFHRPASVFFDPRSIFSYVSTYFAGEFDGSSVSILSCFFGWV